MGTMGNSVKMPGKMREFDKLKRERFNDENRPTDTSDQQVKVEKSVETIHNVFVRQLAVYPELPKLLRGEHVNYLKTCVLRLNTSYECLDASRTWLCYWISHALCLLDEELPYNTQSSIVKFLARCQSPNGGFGGGPGQFPHLATTYAAVNTLCIIGTQEAFGVIDRNALQRFLWSLRSPDGSFSMHQDGEVDIRGVYCALSIATLTNIYTDELFAGTAEWLLSCQTYEGGFSGCPGMEAHGGYSFCGLAALIVLRKGHLCDTAALLRWLANRQMRFEGGFQGRTNKLVDVCYSFWQGGTFPLIQTLMAPDGKPDAPHLLFHQEALQEYILVCCQNPMGGLIDKPGKGRDIYHTCYALSGLSVAQQPFSKQPVVIGVPENQLVSTHPIYNIVPEKVACAMGHFDRYPVPKIEHAT